MEIFHKTNFDFLGKKWLFIGLSLVLTAAGLVSLVVKGGPEWGLDFKGGAMIDVRFDKTPPLDTLRTLLAKSIKGEISVQEVKSGGINDVQIGVEAENAAELEDARGKIIELLKTNFGSTGAKHDVNNTGAEALANRLREPLARGGVSLNDDQLKSSVAAILKFRDKDKSGLIANLDELAALPGVGPKFVEVMKQECALAPYNIRNVQVVSPKVTGDLRMQAVHATLYALAAMLIYIAFRFEWTYGLAAVLAVFHDTVMTIGLFSIFNKPIDLTVVAALLTLVGYSMNDTIVVFDRIRENLKTMKGIAYNDLVNLSINQTLSRTVLTSGLTFLTCVALWLFGGPVLNGFAFALVMGVAVGTFSSIFIAAPLVIFLRDFWLSRNGGQAAAVAVAAPASGSVKAAKRTK